MDRILQDPTSLTGQYLRGDQTIPMPETRRLANGKNLTVFGAQENNLRDVDVTITLGAVHLHYGRVWLREKARSSMRFCTRSCIPIFHDSRVMSGKHRGA